MVNALHKGNAPATAGGMAAIALTVTSVSLMLGGTAVGLSCERWATGPKQCDDAWLSGLGSAGGGALGLIGTWLKNPYLRKREEDEPAAAEAESEPSFDPRCGPPPLVDPWPDFASQSMPAPPQVESPRPQLISSFTPGPSEVVLPTDELAALGLEEPDAADEIAEPEPDLREDMQEQLDALAVQLDEKIAQEIKGLERRLGGAIAEALSHPAKRSRSAKGFTPDPPGDGEAGL